MSAALERLRHGNFSHHLSMAAPAAATPPVATPAAAAPPAAAPAIATQATATQAAVTADRRARASAALTLWSLRRAGATARVAGHPEPTDGHRSQSPKRWSHAALAGRVVELSASHASAVLTLAMGLVREAQREGEPVAWISDDESGFYPPDAAANGVELAALAVVRLPRHDSVRLPRQDSARTPQDSVRLPRQHPAQAPRQDSVRGMIRKNTRAPADGAAAIARAAERLARSGAFGLIVLDLGAGAAIPAPLQGRLTQHAQRHAITILCLTEKAGGAPSLGSLISLHGQAMRRRAGALAYPGKGSRQQPGQRPGAEQALGRFVSTLTITKDKRRGPGWSHEEVHRAPPGLR